MMHFDDTFHDSCEQQRAEGHDMHGCQGIGELLIIAGQAMASPRPGTMSLHYPASWHQHKAFTGLGPPCYLEVQGVRLGLLRRVLPRLRLVDRGDLHGIARSVLDLCGQRMHLVAVGLVGRGHRHGQQMTQRIDRLVARRAAVVCGSTNLHAFGGPDRPVDEKSGDATGIGDIVLRAKYHLYKGLVADIAGALSLKLPSGDEDNLLSTKPTTLRPFLIVSRTFFDVFTPHLNLGYEIDFDRGHQDALHSILGFETGIEKFSVLVDVLGKYKPNGNGVGDHTLTGSFGDKWNPFKQFAMFLNFQVPLNE
jgi:hypothetical protein